MEPSLRELEEHAYGCWPAEQVVPLGGWRLRFTRGVTRRGNSVWTCGRETGGSFEERLDSAERFYADHGQPTLFQLSPLSSPPDLDQQLAARGYATEAPVSVEVADAADVERACERASVASPAPGLGTRVESEPFDDWLEITVRRGRFSQAADIYRALLERLRGRAVYVLAELDGRPAAAALGGLGGGWLGISSMATLPAARRRGAARAVLAALARAARERGAERLYLQVERENVPARALYARAGFTEAYGYHYRRRAPRGPIR